MRKLGIENDQLASYIDLQRSAETKRTSRKPLPDNDLQYEDNGVDMLGAISRDRRGKPVREAGKSTSYGVCRQTANAPTNSVLGTVLRTHRALSSAGERRLDMAEVSGSIPLAPTNPHRRSTIMHTTELPDRFEEGQRRYQAYLRFERRMLIGAALFIVVAGAAFLGAWLAG